MNDWVLDAVCRQIGPAPWFPDHETDTGYAKAIAYCQTCPVVMACLNAALRNEAGTRASNRHGVSGGLTPHQRGALQNELEHGTRSCYINDLCRCVPCTVAHKTPIPKTALAA